MVTCWKSYFELPFSGAAIYLLGREVHNSTQIFTAPDIYLASRKIIVASVLQVFVSCAWLGPRLRLPKNQRAPNANGTPQKRIIINIH